MAHWRELLLDDRAKGRRVDVYLSLRFEGFSRAAMARYITEGAVVSVDRPLKPSTLLRHGERLRILIPGIAPEAAPPELPPIVYEDDRLIAFDKPAGMLCHPAGQRFVYALIGLARRARPLPELDLLHRIDRETSGVVLLAKDLEANAHVKRAIRAHEFRKVYQAIVHGVVPWDAQIVDAPIGPATGSGVRVRRGIVDGGLPSKTEVRVLTRLTDLTLVECRPISGRTHQIRVHLEHAGFPILGDKLYGQPDAVFLEWLKDGATDTVMKAVGFPRHALHAAGIVVPHPTGPMLRVHAPLAADLQAIVDGAAAAWALPVP
jgi:23S rRNA pseudouridine1911/1915/1917 synthase